VAWERRKFEIASALNFTSAHRDTCSQPNRNVASYTTADRKFSYRFGQSRTGWPGDTAFAMEVQNVRNQAAPFVNNPLGIGYDPSNGNLVGGRWNSSVRNKW
jgi:iron complex outermembrane receptor protein